MTLVNKIRQLSTSELKFSNRDFSYIFYLHTLKPEAQILSVNKKHNMRNHSSWLILQHGSRLFFIPVPESQLVQIYQNMFTLSAYLRFRTTYQFIGGVKSSYCTIWYNPRFHTLQFERTQSLKKSEQRSHDSFLGMSGFCWVSFVKSAP